MRKSHCGVDSTSNPSNSAKINSIFAGGENFSLSNFGRPFTTTIIGSCHGDFQVRRFLRHGTLHAGILGKRRKGETEVLVFERGNLEKYGELETEYGIYLTDKAKPLKMTKFRIIFADLLSSWYLCSHCETLADHTRPQNTFKRCRSRE